jgi:hypothetical protein
MEANRCVEGRGLRKYYRVDRLKRSLFWSRGFTAAGHAEPKLCRCLYGEGALRRSIEVRDDLAKGTLNSDGFKKPTILGVEAKLAHTSHCAPNQETALTYLTSHHRVVDERSFDLPNLAITTAECHPPSRLLIRKGQHLTVL